MSANTPSLNKVYYPLLISLSLLITFQFLFLFRAYDDNRLTSWNWTFAGMDVSRIILLLALGMIVAYLLSRFSFPERNPAISIFVFSFLSCLLFWREPEIIVDSSRYFTQAKHLELYGATYFIREWGHEINAWTDLPLLPFLYGIIFKVFGESRVCIQTLNAILFSMTAVCTYLAGKALWNEDVGFTGGLLLSGIPYLLIQTPLMLVDIGTMFFIIFSVFTFTMALTRGGIWIAAASCAIFSAVFSKYSTWMMLSVLGIVFLALLLEKNPAPRFRSRLLSRGFSVLLITLIPVMAIVLYKYDVIAEQITLLLTYQKPALKGWGESFASTYLFQVHPFITAAAVFSVYSAIRKRDIRYTVISWLTFLMIVLWVERIRYIAPTFPLFTLMASYGLQTIRDRKLRRFLVFALVSVSLVIGLFVYLPFLKKMGPANLKDAGSLLNTLHTPSVEVLTLPSKTFSINPAVSVPLLDLYTHKEVFYRYEEVQPPKKTETSPLRFTWTYKNPVYYERGSTIPVPKERTLVIITSGHRESLPEHIQGTLQGFRKTAEFRKTSGVFRYSPDVLIYTKGED
jgi:hypothetical protein